MADFNITISNTLAVLSPTPTSKWGTMQWGDNWGETRDLNFEIYKYIADTATLSDTWYKSIYRTISNSISTVSAMDRCCLQDGSGYEYYFPGGTTDPDDELNPTYTEQSASDPGWTQTTDDTQSWSES